MFTKPSGLQKTFSYADLLNANISAQQAGQIILGATATAEQHDPGSAPGVAALLAAILKSQKKNNCDYRPYPFNLNIWQQQMVIAANPNREYLIIQNVGSGDLLIVFEVAGTEVTDFSASANDQQQLITKQTRAIRLVAGGSYEPATAPRNPVTIFTLNTATLGLIVEGSA